MNTQTKTIQNAMDFPMDDILGRYTKEEELTEDVAKEHERELKRFLVLCALNTDSAYGMAGPIDELWHTFVVFTKNYKSFCDQVAGRFIHHVPNTGGNGSLEPYKRMLADYEHTFGEAPPAHLWPDPEHLKSSYCDGCDGCSGGCDASTSDTPKATMDCSGCEGCSTPY